MKSSLTAVSDQRLCLWIPPAFLKKLLDQKTFNLKFQKRLFRQTEAMPSGIALYF